MPVKISGTVKLRRDFKKFLPDARTSIAKDMKRSIVDIIVEKIVSGLSPVRGQNRYPKYSDAYGKVKGRKQPVDLVQSGDMLNNLKAVITSRKNIRLEFPNALQRKKAKRHNSGLNGMPKRKILPTVSGEVFKKDILNKIIAIMNKAIQKTIR